MKKLLKYGVATLTVATLTAAGFTPAATVFADDTSAEVVYTKPNVEDLGATIDVVTRTLDNNIFDAGYYKDNFPVGGVITIPEVEGYEPVRVYSVQAEKDIAPNENGEYIFRADHAGYHSRSHTFVADVDVYYRPTTPPSDNTGGDTGGQDQTPPADNGGSDQTDGQTTPPADTGSQDQTPPAEAPKPQTLTVVETREDANGAVLFTKTHSLVLNPGEEKDLGYNPDREVLVRGGNLYRYGNFEEGVTLYFTTRLKPATADAGTPATPTTPSAEDLVKLVDRLEALRQEVVALDPQLAQGYLTWYGERLPEVLKKIKAGDAQAYAAYDFVNIEKDLIDRLATLKANQTPAPTRSVPASADQVATTRNQLLAQVDKSSLTDAQKGELAVKITFAETAEELTKLAAELASLTAPAQKSAPASVDKSANADQPVATTSAKTLPATGELTTEALTAMGLALVLFSLGLAKARKTN